MAWIREAPSGGWRAEYRGSDGRKHSQTLLPKTVNLRPSSRDRIEDALRSHVLPALGA
jgi:hypothetical protein